MDNHNTCGSNNIRCGVLFIYVVCIEKMGILSSLKKIFSSSDKKGTLHLKEELRKILYEADLGSVVTEKLLNGIKNFENLELVRSDIENTLTSFLEKYQGKLVIDKKPFISMVAGVNGVGKTTACAKLAHFIKVNFDKTVLLAGADTFRAAAVEQLEHWAKKTGCHFFSKGKDSDPGAVAYESVTKAIKENIDVVIIDTGGRLHTQKGLMSEISKVQKAVSKALSGAPHYTFLTVDSTQGQNMATQCEIFKDFIDISGVILTKFDGSAKAGALINSLQKLEKPVFFVGIGEREQDLVPFTAKSLPSKIFSE
ncbi:MAG: signal recognition particle-docking protein FtsY [Pseudomonadota bacterium]